MVPWHGNTFHFTDSLWGESTGHRSIPPTKGLYRSSVDSPHKGHVMQSFGVDFMYKPEHAVELNVNLSVIWDTMTLMLRHRNAFE